MDESNSPERLSQFPLSEEELFALELEAAKRLVRFEIESTKPIGKLYDSVDEIVFPGELNEATDTAKKQIRLNVSKLIKQATGSRIHPTVEETLLGLEKIEQEHKKS